MLDIIYPGRRSQNSESEGGRSRCIRVWKVERRVFCWCWRNNRKWSARWKPGIALWFCWVHQGDVRSIPVIFLNYLRINFLSSLICVHDIMNIWMSSFVIRENKFFVLIWCISIFNCYCHCLKMCFRWVKSKLDGKRSWCGYFYLFHFILQKHKCVPLEEIAAEFKLRTQVALVV